MDEEPYNLSTWRAARQAWRPANSGARLVFFSWQNLHRDYPPPFNWMERSVYRRAAHAIAGNQAAARVLRAKGYDGPLSVIPQFGVDPALYGVSRPPAPDAPFVIGYVGRLVPEKGVADLLHAASGLSGEWRIRLFGAGPQRDALSATARSLGIAERVVFEGQVPSPDIPAYLSELHALALPSHTRPNWMEQFGRVLIEGMASGMPVVGSDSGEIPNVIGDAGLVFAQGDVEDLRRRLQALMNDRALWADLARRGRERVLAHFTQAQVAAQTVRVYREALVGQSHLDQKPVETGL
jgi:glycosyltransferase involved in cell wall biosynthesis